MKEAVDELLLFDMVSLRTLELFELGKGVLAWLEELRSMAGMVPTIESEVLPGLDESYLKGDDTKVALVDNGKPEVKLSAGLEPLLASGPVVILLRVVEGAMPVVRLMLNGGEARVELSPALSGKLSLLG